MNIPFRQYKNINIFTDIQKYNIDHFSANLTRKLQTIGMYKQRNILYNINKKNKNMVTFKQTFATENHTSEISQKFSDSKT